MRRELLRLTLPLREPWRGAMSQELAVVRAEDDDGVVGLGDAPAGYEPAAYEIAARDLEARRAGTRLTEPLADSVPVNHTIVAAGAADCARSAAEGAAAGFTCFKLKVGLSGDAERTAAVREAIGPSAELRLDANAAWSPAEASERIAELAPHDIAYVEQPCPKLTEMAEVEADVPLAADESIASADDVRLAAELDACAVVVIKLARSGGFGPARAAARAAREAGLRPVIASLLDGPWGVAAAAQLSAAEGIEDACGLATLGAFHGDLAELLPIRDGRMTLPRGPGLGIDVTPDQLGALEGA